MSTLQIKTLPGRLLRSRMLWLLVFAALLCSVVFFALRGVSNSVDTNQIAFVEDSVRRSAVQCYAIEGRFPGTIGGVQYLEHNYGLTIDYSRYAIYYESMGDNLMPAIRVIPIHGGNEVQTLLSGGGS
ncbi:MAG: hypothetical protein LBI64_03595 [Coriobacteriales bacterium]|jgi:hypothetical protein|nr:hypothetical protein [Coriobacteriales bacterium]